MIIQWGDNPEYAIETWYDFTSWKLPFGINWRAFSIGESKNFNLEIMFLCFGIKIEIWWWRKNNG